MANNKIVLYDYFRSSSAWRLRLVLNLKKLDYEQRPVNLVKNEQTSPEFLKVNPMGQVPTLLVDGTTLTQSVSIFEYLEEAFPAKPLLPKDIFKRAKVREIVELIVSGIQPIQNLSVLYKFPEEKRKQWAHDAIATGFTALERLLQQSNGKYCVGDTVTWADCCLIPQRYNANKFGVDMSKFPLISRIGASLEQLPDFAAAHPTQQQDCPKT